MNFAQNYLRKFPHARPTTISDRLKVQAKCEELKIGIAAKHSAKPSRVSHQPEAGLLSRTVRMFGKLLGNWGAV